MNESLNPPQRSPWWIRLILVVVGLGLWFWTQALIAARPPKTDVIHDVLLHWTAPANEYLNAHTQAADLLLIVSSLLINLLAAYILGRAIFGPTVRPFLGLLMLFALRQVCQGLVALPVPPGMVWNQPILQTPFGPWEVPGLLVTYGVSYDFFFSGHTAIAVYGAIELARLSRRWLLVAIPLAVFQAGAVIVLRAHWTMDVFAGVVTAILCALLANWLAPSVDRVLARVGPKSADP